MNATVNSKDVHTMYLPEVGKWVIVEDDTADLVKSYNTEADCMFDYAALRNGETTIDEVKNN